MTKILFITIISFVLFTSCESGSEGIVVEDIETPCDCVRSYKIIVNEILAIAGPARNKRELDDDQKEEIEVAQNKFFEVADRCEELGIQKWDMRECNGWRRLQRKFEKVEEVSDIN